MEKGNQKIRQNRLIDYFCIIGNKSGSNESNILARYPMEDHEDFPLPVNVVYFCQPEGCTRIESKRASLKTLTSFVFTLTDKDSGITTYGICLNFYRPCENNSRIRSHRIISFKSHTESDSAFSSDYRSSNPWTISDSENEVEGVEREEEEEEEEKLSERKVIKLVKLRKTQRTSFDSSSSPEEPFEKRKKHFKTVNKTYTLTSLLLLSHHPFFRNFSSLLSELKGIFEYWTPGKTENKGYPWSLWTTVQDSHSFELTSYFKDIQIMIERLLEAPGPSVSGQNGVELQIFSESLPLRFAYPDPSRFSLCDYPIHLPLELLGVSSFLQVLTLILLERKIVIQSREISALTLSVMAFTKYLYPFEYMFPVIPLLPPSLESSEQLLSAPTPFIIGIPTNFFSLKKNVDKFPDEIWVINLDDNTIIPPPGSSLADIPPLPEPEGRILRTDLKQALVSVSFTPILNFDDLPQESLQKLREMSFDLPSHNSFFFGNDVDSVDIATRVALSKFFDSPNLLSHFEEHVRTLRLYPRPIVAFSSEAFLASKESSSVFLSQLVVSQAMEYLAESSLAPTNFAFQRVRNGVYDPTIIGDKAKWFLQSLPCIFYSLSSPGSSLKAINDEKASHNQSELATDESGSDSEPILSSSSCSTTSQESQKSEANTFPDLSENTHELNKEKIWNENELESNTSFQRKSNEPESESLPQTESSESTAQELFYNIEQLTLQALRAAESFESAKQNTISVSKTLARRSAGVSSELMTELTLRSKTLVIDFEKTARCRKKEFLKALEDSFSGSDVNTQDTKDKKDKEEKNKDTKDREEKDKMEERKVINELPEFGTKRSTRASIEVLSSLGPEFLGLPSSPGSLFVTSREGEMVKKTESQEFYRRYSESFVRPNIETNKYFETENKMRQTSFEDLTIKDSSLICQEREASSINSSPFASSTELNSRSLSASSNYLGSLFETEGSSSEHFSFIPSRRNSHIHHIHHSSSPLSSPSSFHRNNDNNNKTERFKKNSSFDESESFLQETVERVVSGDGLSWLKLNKLRKYMESESHRNTTLKYLARSYETESGPENTLRDVRVSETVWTGILKILLSISHGLEVSVSRRIRGMTSAFTLLEIAHTFFVESEKNSKDFYVSSRNLSYFGNSLKTREIFFFRQSSLKGQEKKHYKMKTSSVKSFRSQGSEVLRAHSLDSSKKEEKEIKAYKKERVSLNSSQCHQNFSFPFGDSIRSVASDSELETHFSTLSSFKSSLNDEWGPKSSLSKGYRFYGGKAVKTSSGLSCIKRKYIFQGLLSNFKSSSSSFWESESYLWEELFYDTVSHERELLGMDLEIREQLSVYENLSDKEKRSLELSEDILLSTILHNLTAFMLMMNVDKKIIERKISRCLGKSHIGLVESSALASLLSDLKLLYGNDIDLKILPSSSRGRRSSWIVQVDSSLNFCEVQENGVSVFKSNGNLHSKILYEQLVNMTYSPKNKVICLWHRKDDQTCLQKMYTTKVRELYYTIKKAMDKAASSSCRTKGFGLESGGEFPVEDLKTGEGGLLAVCMEGVELLFANSKLFIRMTHIRKCYTKKGGIFVLEEFNTQNQQSIKRRYSSSMANDICYSVLCVFSYVAAGIRK